MSTSTSTNMIPERVITMLAVWAESAHTTFPIPPWPGTSYRDTDLTEKTISEGQPYSKVVDSATWNQLWWVMTGMLKSFEQYGILPYSALTNYKVSGICQGLDGILYTAIRASGLGTESGSQPTTNATFWGKSLPPSFPKGTRILFQQSAAPTGWTKEADSKFNDAVLKFTTGSVTTGGTITFANAFKNQSLNVTGRVGGSTGATVLTSSQMPAHLHRLRSVGGWDPYTRGLGYGASTTGGAVVGGMDTQAGPGEDPTPRWYSHGTSGLQLVESTGGNQGHTHSNSGTFSSSGTINLSVKYAGVIIATKD